MPIGKQTKAETRQMLMRRAKTNATATHTIGGRKKIKQPPKISLPKITMQTKDV